MIFEKNDSFISILTKMAPTVEITIPNTTLSNTSPPYKVGENKEMRSCPSEVPRAA
jgi:hypothetical protein